MQQIQYFGRFLDLENDERLNYTIQAQDLADVSSVTSSVTTSFKIPKTISNYEALKHLSLPSDTSRIPYQKNEVKLYDNGTIMINNGWLKVNNSTKDYYNLNIENGIIDFFKAIEGKTIGKDLDLSSTNHSKDLVSVIDSFERTDYCYIIADYNGLNTYTKSGIEYINTDYLIPSLNNKYLWDKIFEFAEFTYSGSMFNTDDFTNLWVTYPKAPPTDISDEEYPEPIKRFETSSNTPIYNYYSDSEGYRIDFTLENIFTNDVDFLNNEITIQNNGTYHLRSYEFEAYAYFMELNNWEEPTGQWYRERVMLGYFLNGVEFRVGSIGLWGLQEIQLLLRAGDKLKFFLYFDDMAGQQINTGNGRTAGELQEVSFSKYNFRLFQVSQSIINFGNEMMEFSITDFVKEVMIRFSLIPFIDVENRHIEFLTLNERLQGNNLIDWSDKLIERTSESYTYNSYAISNHFKHKYNDENATFNNGILTVNNVNLTKDNDLWSSKVYSYNREITSFYSSSFENNSFPIWNREIKEIINNDTNERTFEVKYKGLENRFYFIRRKYLTENVNIGSQLLRVEVVSNNTPLADVSNLSYREIVQNRYNEFGRVLTDTRIHEMDLAINVNDLLSLDLKALYYFSQENQYYILNKITFNLKESTARGEFIRVKYFN